LYEHAFSGFAITILTISFRFETVNGSESSWWGEIQITRELLFHSLSFFCPPEYHTCTRKSITMATTDMALPFFAQHDIAPLVGPSRRACSTETPRRRASGRRVDLQRQNSNPTTFAERSARAGLVLLDLMELSHEYGNQENI
jgi:hypothetical protein